MRKQTQEPTCPGAQHAASANQASHTHRAGMSRRDLLAQLSAVAGGASAASSCGFELAEQRTVEVGEIGRVYQALGTGDFVETLEDLRARVVPTGAEWVAVDRHGPRTMDGVDASTGGGLFRWVSTLDTTSMGLNLNSIFPSGDNDGTIIKPTALQPSDHGRWVRVFEGPISVQFFGAKGDNTVDDSAAIQSAADSAGMYRSRYWQDLSFSQTMPEIFFPPGTYKMQNTVSTLVGMDGDRATLVGDRDVTLFDITAMPTLMARVRGLTFFGYKNVIRSWSAEYDAGFATHLSISDCAFYWGDVVVANNRSQNFYVSMRSCHLFYTGYFRGCSDAFSMADCTASGKLSDNWSLADNDRGDVGEWRGAHLESGGVDEGIECTSHAVFVIDNLMASPGQHSADPEADQSWVKLTTRGAVRISSSRLGGENAGLPLVKAVEDGSSVRVVNTIALSFWQPPFVFEGAPLLYAVEGSTISSWEQYLNSPQISDEAFDKLKRRDTDYLDAENSNRSVLGDPAEGANLISPSTRFHMLSRMYRQSGMSSVGSVNHAHSVGNVVDTGYQMTWEWIEDGFDGLDTGRITSSVAGGYFYAIKYLRMKDSGYGAGIYTATLYYRSQGVEDLQLGVRLGYGTGTPFASLVDSEDQWTRTSYTFYHDGSSSGTNVQMVVQGVLDSGESYVDITRPSVTGGLYSSEYVTNDLLSQQDTTKHYVAAGPPSLGAWRKGDMVFNTDPSVDTPWAGWICMDGGPPAVWRPFGAIDL